MGTCVPEYRDMKYWFRSNELTIDRAGNGDEVELVPFRMLPGGVRSMLAMVADMAWRCSVLNEHLGPDAVTQTPGVVLIDEIDLHLHPSWQRHVVGDLKRAFPKVQFIVTTHNPLCLRGLQEGEVAVMCRTADNDIVALTDLPPVEGLRVEQLLTSELFGLSSTVDPELDEMFEEYYRLLAARELNDLERARLEELTSQLERYDVLGTTRRERMALEAIDSYLAEETAIVDPEERQELKQETREKVKDIWSAMEWED